MKQYALIGQGIKQSLSPFIHKIGARLSGIEINYSVLEPESLLELGILVKELRAGKWDGFNVTTPFKSDIIQFLDQCSLGAVNTLVKSADQIMGSSTDGQGFSKGLNCMNVDFQTLENVWFLGSGGAVLSLTEYLGKLDPKRAEPIRFRSLVRDLQSNSVQKLRIFSERNDIPLEFITSSQELCRVVGGSTLLIEARPHGSSEVGINTGEFLTDLPKSTIYYDLNYQLKKSDGFNLALRHFDRCIDGLPMLIEQARLAQILWWGSKIQFDELNSAVLAELDEGRGRSS